MLFVFASPGDETRAAGGTIAAAADAGGGVTVLTCARPSVGETAAATAMAHLGVTDHRYLGDAGARIQGASPRRYTAGGSPDDLERADPGEIAADIATVIALTGATAVITGSSRTSAEALVGAAVRHACEVMEIECHEVASPGSGSDVVDVDVTAFAGRIDAALAAYGTESSRGAERVESFRPAFRARSAEWAGLGVAARVIALLGALAGGAAIGALGTVVFQASPMIGSVAVPLGLIAALAVMACVLVGLRLVFQTRIVAAAAALGILAVITLLSQESPGGSILIPAFPLSYAWVYGPPLIAAGVLAWPDLTRARRAREAVPLGPSADTPG